MPNTDQDISVVVRAQIGALLSGMKEAGASVDQFAQKGNTVTNNFYAMGGAGEQAGKRMSDGAKKAKDALDLAAHSAGVAMPRELKKLIAHFETLGPIIAKAFSVFAVIAFLEFIYQLLEQIPKLADKVMGLDDNLKGMAASTAKLNDELRDQAVRIENAKFDALKAGLTGSQKAAVDQAQAIYNAKEKQKEFNTALADYDALRKQIEAKEQSGIRIPRIPGTDMHATQLNVNSLPGMKGALEEKKQQLQKLQEQILLARNAEIQAQVDVTAAIRTEHARQAEIQIADSRREVDYYKQGTKGREEAERALLNTIEAIHGRGSEQYRAALHEQEMAHRAYADKIAQQTHDMNSEAIRARQERNLTLNEIDAQGAQFQADMGVITRQKQLEQEKLFLDREHDIRIGSLQRLIEAEKVFLKKDPTRDPQTLQKLLEQLYQTELQYQQRVTELQRKSSLQRATDFRKHFDVMSQSFKAHTQAMVLGYESLAQASKGLLADMVSDFVGMLTDMLMKWIEHLILRMIFGKAIGKSSAASTIAEQAAVGYAGAYASTSMIPIIGPELAPGVAAATYASIMAAEGMLGFAKGGIVPEDTIAQVHKKEMILPEHIAEQFTEGGAGRPTAIHFHNQMLDSRGVEGVLSKNARTLVKVLKGRYKAGAFKRV